MFGTGDIDIIIFHHRSSDKDPKQDQAWARQKPSLRDFATFRSPGNATYHRHLRVLYRAVDCLTLRANKMLS
jgi:hypothetical protein